MRLLRCVWPLFSPTPYPFAAYKIFDRFFLQNLVLVYAIGRYCTAMQPMLNKQ